MIGAQLRGTTQVEQCQKVKKSLWDEERRQWTFILWDKTMLLFQSI